MAKLAAAAAAITGLLALPTAAFQPPGKPLVFVRLQAEEEPATPTRRTFIGAAWSAATAASLSAPAVGAAANAGSPAPVKEEGLLPASEVARRLRQVPTFTIVDKRGVPFMVFGEDAKLTAYFFTTYGEAARILDVAAKSSDKTRADLTKEIRAKRKAQGQPPLPAKEEADEVGINPWKDARISTVPLDFAVTLASKSGSQRGGAVYFKISPTEDDVSDALALDKSGKEDLPEGKVPLFYFEDFELPEKVTPLYFRKSELIAAWKKQNPDKDLPEILVSELLSVVAEMVRPGGKDEDLKSLVFIPPLESLKKAKECEKKGGKEQPFIIGERIVVL